VLGQNHVMLAVGVKVPWNESSGERKFRITFAGDESSRERKFHLWNFCSQEQKYMGMKVL